MDDAIFSGINRNFLNEVSSYQSKYPLSWLSRGNSSYSGTSFHLGQKSWGWRQEHEWVLGKVNWERQILQQKIWKKIWRISRTEGQDWFGGKDKDAKRGEEGKERRWNKANQRRLLKVFRKFYEWVCLQDDCAWKWEERQSKEKMIIRYILFITLLCAKLIIFGASFSSKESSLELPAGLFGLNEGEQRWQTLENVWERAILIYLVQTSWMSCMTSEFSSDSQEKET